MCRQKIKQPSSALSGSSQHINQTRILDHLCGTKPYAVEQDTTIACGYHSSVVYLQIYHYIAIVLSYQPHKPTYNQQ